MDIGDAAMSKVLSGIVLVLAVAALVAAVIGVSILSDAPREGVRHEGIVVWFAVLLWFYLPASAGSLLLAVIPSGILLARRKRWVDGASLVMSSAALVTLLLSGWLLLRRVSGK